MRTRIGIAALVPAALVLLADCGGHKAAPHGIVDLDPASLPSLPAQGLVVDKRGGVLLEDLDGTVIGRLPGYRPYTVGKISDRAFVRSVGDQALATADLGLVVLFGPGGRGMVLDPGAKKLEPIGRFRTSLAGGASLVVHVTGSASKGVGATTAVVKAGKTLLAGYLTVTGNRYASSSQQGSGRKGVLLDVVTGARWTIGAGCTVAGVVEGRAIAACMPTGGNVARRSGVYSIAPDGARHTLAIVAPGLYPEFAWLSPDSHWVLLYFSPGCGPGWAVLMPTAGGKPRYVVGGAAVPSGGPTPAARYSSALGWSSDGKIVATIAGTKPSSCEHESHSGTFLIDPASLARTRSTAAIATTLWGAAGA